MFYLVIFISIFAIALFSLFSTLRTDKQCEKDGE